jgi:phospholipid-translocating ATPase
MDKQENRSVAWVLDRGVRANPSNRPKKVVGGGKWKKMIDEKENRDRGYEPFLRYGNNGWMTVQWQDVQVGDLIRLRRDDAVPADIAILHATGPNGIAYIDTMALDGETNLKSKQACPLFTERCSTEEGLIATRAMIVSEDPNLDLYSYDGRVTVGDETLPLTMNNVVYRGSTIRNTSMVIGIVVNSGEECKIRMNANKNVHAKKPAMQSIVNKIVLIQMVGVIAITAGLTAGYFIWQDPTEDNSFYLVQRGVYDASVPAHEIFFGYLIMFNTLIPLSLYISLEIIKIGQFFMMLDAELYDPVSDTPMVANTTTILENLGQVTHVFSDKTGTLTENIMRFRKMSVAGIACLHDMDVDKDESAKQNRINARNNAIKGKSKVEPVQSGEDDWPLRSTPQRNPSTVSRSKWRSSVHPNEMPEMNTEELLAYVRRKPNSAVSRKVKHFLLCIALCHTCLPELNESGELVYQSSSPDELALIEAARDLGYLLVDRPSNSIKLQTTNANGATEVETYQVLDVIEFSSKRKRMSIIIRMPDGRISVICKGADNVIMARLRQKQLADEKVRDVGRRISVRRTQEQEQALQRMSSYGDANYGSPRESFQSGRRDSWRRSLTRRSNEYHRYSQHYERDHGELQSPMESDDPMQTYDSSNYQVDESIATSDTAVFEKTFQDINDFASDGLRTLLFGYRYIDEDSYWKWKDIYRQAETSLVDRQERIEKASELIEQKFELAGATAIEDKLQDGVPESIDKLRRANIKVWMLTGDKRETAINIGHSARLCKPYSTIFVLDVKEGNLEQLLAEKLKELAPGSVAHSVMVVDGETLAAIDDDEDLAPTFYDLAVLVDSVICCRASPSQKAHLVKSIRRFVPKSMTLAIGDGANDIGMIQASHVGIGISGREGLQAARISDYSIAQFRFLQKLLFVHGRWNYLRTGKYVLGTFWKEILFFLVQAHYQRFNGYSGTSLYEEWSLTVFNILFTSLPVILMGIFEKDLSADTLMAVPELYTFGQRKMGFNYFQYLGWVIMGVAGSFIIYYFMWLEYRSVLFDNDNDIFSIGVICFTVAVIFINVKLL